MRRWILWALLPASFSSTASGQPGGASIPNWTVPPYTEPAGFTTMTDVTEPRVFVGVQPCRIVDTRSASGFPTGFGAPSLAPGVPRPFTLHLGPCTGLPIGIDAYSLNVTVVNPSGPGHIVIYPKGLAQPTVSSLNFLAGQTIANAVIVPAGLDGAIIVVAGISGTDLLIDVNGYFSDRLGDPLNSLVLRNNARSAAIVAINDSTLCSGACGVSARSFGGSALHGVAAASTGETFGAAGINQSSSADSAGVFGQSEIPNVAGNLLRSGVRGEAGGVGHGVAGISEYYGVAGYLVDPKNGGIDAAGFLGSAVFSDPPGAPPWGIFSLGPLGGSGAKYFVDPHPTDPSKAITYVSLEGPEAGTYFRGRGRFLNGIARVVVPEHFRLVTDSEGLTVQVTPIGDMATFAVVRMGLEEIVVRSSRDVEFSYLVQGVRSTHRDLKPVRNGTPFVPPAPGGKMPGYLTEAQKRRLIANGTYNEDGTVNMETARRLGWVELWERSGHPVAAPSPE